MVQGMGRSQTSRRIAIVGAVQASGSQDHSAVALLQSCGELRHGRICAALKVIGWILPCVGATLRQRRETGTVGQRHWMATTQRHITSKGGAAAGIREH